ncbi:MAG TPA: hypothetical protein VI112_12085 [Bacteroidia bacterium]|jgi:hypothetical protein
MKNKFLILFIAVFGFAAQTAFAQRDENRGGGDGGSTDYSKARVYFTNDVSDDGTIGDEGTSYIINKKKGSYVYCIVSNYPNPLNTEKFTVEIYKEEGSDYKLQETKYYNISRTTKTTYFKYTFHIKGEYKFTVYNEDNKLISSGYVTIKYK